MRCHIQCGVVHRALVTDSGFGARRPISGRRTLRSPARGEHRLCLRWLRLLPLLPRLLDESFGAQRRRRSQELLAGQPALAR